MEEFKRDVTILENEYVTEREEMEQTHHDHLKELNDMIETVKEEDRRKAEETRTELDGKRGWARGATNEEEKLRQHCWRHTREMWRR